MFERLLSPLRSRLAPSSSVYAPSIDARFLILAGLVTVAVAAFALPLVRRSITLGDEGYLLLQSLDMLQGKVLYRDLDAFVTPGIWFVLAGVFSLVEPSVIASRIPVFVAYLALVLVSYRIAALMAGRRSGLVAVGLMLACSVWAFPAWTFAFYSPLSVLFALAGLERMLAWSERGEDTRAIDAKGVDGGRGCDLVWSGVLFGLAIVFKQNYGTLALIGGAIGAVAIRLDGREPLAAVTRALGTDALRMAAGVAAVGLPVFGYFVYQGVVPELFQSLVVHPFEFSGKHDIPYLGLGKLFDGDFMADSVEMYTYAAQAVYTTASPGGLVTDWSVIERLHVLLYWIPPLVFAVGTLLVLRPVGLAEARDGQGRRVDGRLAAVLTVTFMLYLGVFPRADFNHLVNVYQAVVVAGVVVAHALLARLPHPRPLWLRGAIGLASALIGLYAAVAAYWYHELIIRLDTPVAGARGGVLVNGREAAHLGFMLDAIEKLVPPGRALLTIPDLAMLNFLTARPMPSAYYNLYEHHIAHDGGATVVAGAETHGVDVAVTRYNDFFSDRVGLREYAPELVDYLATHYALTWRVGIEDYLIFRRREAPVPLVGGTSVLDRCDPVRGWQEIKRHLFFDAVHHNPGAGVRHPRGEVRTSCRVRVPAEGAELMTRIVVRKPAKVIEPGSLTVEILAGREGEPRVPVLSERFELLPKNPHRYHFPPGREFRVDLSAYAGEELVLELRTIRVGRVVMERGNLRTFGVGFADPRIVPRSRPGSLTGSAE